MIFTDTMFWRLVWKEYRAQRGFWLAVAGFSIGLMLILNWLSIDENGRAGATWSIAVALPALYALGSAAVVFASETEEGTTDLLRIMAARPSRVFFGKVGFSLVSTLAMWASLLVVARILNWRYATPALGLHDEMTWRIVMTSIFAGQFLAWGFLFSILCGKVMTAASLTAVGTMLFLCLFHMPFGDRLPIFGWAIFTNFGWAYFLSVVTLLPAAHFLTSRTMAGRTFGWSMPRLNWRRTSAIAQLDRLAAIRETAPAWRRLFTRLAWLELRYALSLGHILSIAGILLLNFVWIPFGAPAAFWNADSVATLGIFSILLSAPLIGIWTFQADGGKRARFLADLGLSPMAVWLGKQLVWGMLAVAITGPCILMIGIANELHIHAYRNMLYSVFHRDVPGASAVAFAFALACQGYAAGQFAAVLIPRGVTAGYVGFAISTLLAPWAWWMIDLQVPLCISVAPLIVIKFALKFALSLHWLMESETWRSRTPQALVT